MKAITAIVVVCSLIPLVLGHGWVMNPQPRGYTGDQGGASTSGPCGAGTTYPQTAALTAGDHLNVTWDIGGGHDTGTGSKTCRFAWSLTDTSATDFDSQTLVTNIPCTAGNGQFYNVPININGLAASTTAYLQWKWSAGDGGQWYGCIKMLVSPIGVSVTDETEGTAFSDTIDPVETGYYKVNADANKHVYVTISATGNTLFSFAGGSLPSTNPNTTNSWANSTAGSTFILSGCSLEDTATSFYLAAFGGSSSLTFTATAESYDAMMFPVYKAPQITDSLQHGGSKFYWTEAYTDGATYKRVYVQKTSGSGLVRLWKSLKCLMNNMNSADEAENDMGSKGACIDLGTTQGRKYIQVESVNGTNIDFELGVEDGQCADKSFDAASSLQVSFVLLIAALLAML